MGRVADWQPEKWDREFGDISMDILRQLAEEVASEARARVPGNPSTYSRPPFRHHMENGKKVRDNPVREWTRRDAGALAKTIRVVEKHDQDGRPLAEGRNIRVYAGNYLRFYAAIVNKLGGKGGKGKGYMSRSLDAARRAFDSIVPRVS